MKTYHIAKNGQDSDGFDGDKDHAWLTGNYAMTRIKGGDTLILDDGVYVEAWRNVIPSGTQANPTTIKALNARKAILRPGDSRYYVVEITQPRQWIVIDGIDADGAGVTLYGSYYFYSETGELSNIVLRNGVARGCINDGEYGPVGIMLGGHKNVAGHHHFQVLNMDSSRHVNTANVGPGDGYGLYLAASDSLIKGCTFAKNGGYQLHKYTASQVGLDRNIITENEIDGSASNKGQAAVILSGGKGNRFFKNNVIGSSASSGVDIAYSENDTVVEDNIIQKSAGAAVRVRATDGKPSKNQVINNHFDENEPNAVLDEVGDTIVYGNTVGVIVPNPPTPTGKKYKFAATGAGFAATGEVTLEEL